MNIPTPKIAGIQMSPLPPFPRPQNDNSLENNPENFD
jgi:hypothetical protein